MFEREGGGEGVLEFCRGEEGTRKGTGSALLWLTAGNTSQGWGLVKNVRKKTHPAFEVTQHNDSKAASRQKKKKIVTAVICGVNTVLGAEYERTDERRPTRSSFVQCVGWGCGVGSNF